jgi:hypothetical protein
MLPLKTRSLKAGETRRGTQFTRGLTPTLHRGRDTSRPYAGIPCRSTATTERGPPMAPAALFREDPQFHTAGPGAPGDDGVL